ncbi:helix-turn-helix domain-containing protein [Tenacibaculum sp. nBUS_03]|uniref:helix-turn-helix domain-containing protein n=1 Tax=Tenacibaculum sp. nBUS_03 TaxID=3395320 RepID=UPI003EB971F6
MKSIYKIRESNNKIVVIDYSEEPNVAHIEERKKVNEFDYVEGTIEEILLNEVKVLFRNQQLKSALNIEVEHDFPLFKIHFELEGNSQYIPDNDQEKSIEIKGGCYNFFFLPSVKGTLSYNSDTRKSVEIFFTEAYLKKIFKEHFDEVSTDFGIALNRNISFLMFEDSQPIPASLSLIINDIINCSYDKDIKQVYVESKINEIFSFLFSEIKNRNKSKPALIKKNEYNQILEAERIITANLKTPPTIEQLSKLIGINQYKLKTQFKLVFKEPIFSYISSLRMEKAKKMLLEKNLTVSEVAYAIGYKNPQHFTAAFKKKFNYLPSSLKQKQILVTNL